MTAGTIQVVPTGTGTFRASCTVSAPVSKEATTAAGAVAALESEVAAMKPIPGLLAEQPPPTLSELFGSGEQDAEVWGEITRAAYSAREAQRLAEFPE